MWKPPIARCGVAGAKSREGRWLAGGYGRIRAWRVAGQEGKLYLDLTDDAWRAVEIDEAGWRIVNEPPVRFRRAAGMQPLPTPTSGGAVEMLRTFLNVSGNGDFVLVVAWALAVLHDKGPYPVIVLSGEQGSAKATFYGHPAGASRSQLCATPRPAKGGSRPIHRGDQWIRPDLRQRVRPATVDF